VSCPKQRASKTVYEHRQKSPKYCDQSHTKRRAAWMNIQVAAGINGRALSMPQRSVLERRC